MKSKMDLLVERANNNYDGHVSILKFTTGWKVIFGTVNLVPFTKEYNNIFSMTCHKKLENAIDECLRNNYNTYMFGDYAEDIKDSMRKNGIVFCENCLSRDVDINALITCKLCHHSYKNKESK